MFLRKHAGSSLVAFTLLSIGSQSPWKASSSAPTYGIAASTSVSPADTLQESQAPTSSQRLAIRSLDGKLVRLLPLVGESNRTPMWSPDGTAIAFQVRENGRHLIGVVQSDGSNPRVFRTAVCASGQSALWSPDSRTIGFLDPSRREFRILTIKSGSVRTIATDSTAQIGVWRWRPDGRSIAAVKTIPGALPGLRNLRRRIDEIMMDGSRRPLLDTTAMRGVPGVTFIDANTIFVRYDSATYRIPLEGGTPQRLGSLVGDTRPYAGVHNTAPGSDVWAGVSPGDVLKPGRIEFISAKTGERREVLVPFHPSPGPSPEWTPDGRGLVVIGWPMEDTTGISAETIQRARDQDTVAVNHILARSPSKTVLYLVPVYGAAPKLIAEFGATDWWIHVSPNGKYVVHGMTDVR